MPSRRVASLAEAPASAGKIPIVPETVAVTIPAVPVPVPAVMSVKAVVMVKIVKVAEGKAGPKGEETETTPVAAWLPPIPRSRRHPTRTPVVTVAGTPIEVDARVSRGVGVIGIIIRIVNRGCGRTIAQGRNLVRRNHHRLRSRLVLRVLRRRFGLRRIYHCRSRSRLLLDDRRSARGRSLACGRRFISLIRFLRR